jgi:hypothetical protein
MQSAGNAEIVTCHGSTDWHAAAQVGIRRHFLCEAGSFASRVCGYSAAHMVFDDVA